MTRRSIVSGMKPMTHLLLLLLLLLLVVVAGLLEYGVVPIVVGVAAVVRGVRYVWGRQAALAGGR